MRGWWMSGASKWIGMAVATASLLALAPSAQAKIPIPVNTGNEIFEVGPLPPSLQAADPELASWKLGYMCDRFGILFADVWTWNCKLVAYDGKTTYSDLPPEVRATLEAEYPMSKARRGFWNHYGIGVLVAGFMAVGMLKGSS